MAEKIKEFLEKYDIEDNMIEKYDEKQKNQIESIIEGKLTDYDDGIMSRYAGLYALYVLDDHRMAEKYFLKGIDQMDNDSSHYLAHICDEDGRNEEAEKYFLHGSERGDVRSIYRLGLMYEDSEQYDKAEYYWKMGVDHNDNNSITTLGCFYWRMNKWDDAQRYLLLGVDRNIGDSMHSLGWMNQKMENYDLAEKYFLMAIDNENTTEHPLNSLGEMYYEQKKYDKLISIYLREYEKGNAELCELALILCRGKKYKLAEKYFIMAIENQKNDMTYNSYCELAKMYCTQKKYDKAEKYFMLSIENGYGYAYNELAMMYSGQEKYDQAERYFMMSIENGYKVFHELADMYCKQGKYDQAKKYYLRGMDCEVSEYYQKCAYEGLSRIIPNILLKYTLLSKIENKTELINKILKQLESKKEIRYYRNKISFGWKEAECPICYQTTKTIQRECAHQYCSDCYVRIDRCAFGCDQ
jgi:tetratricopeptide (TPR) repeat protein